MFVNEIFDWEKRKKKSCLLLKVDFEKAYDTVSWNYFKFVMKSMVFNDILMKWMKSCIFTSHMSILVNGSATKDFKAHKGLRQVDPLSPFLFVQAMEGLTSLVRKSVDIGDVRPFKFGKEEFIDIVQFTEDTNIIGDSSSDNLWSLKVILRGF